MTLLLIISGDPWERQIHLLLRATAEEIRAWHAEFLASAPDRSSNEYRYGIDLIDHEENIQWARSHVIDREYYQNFQGAVPDIVDAFSAWLEKTKPERVVNFEEFHIEDDIDTRSSVAEALEEE